MNLSLIAALCLCVLYAVPSTTAIGKPRQKTTIGEICVFPFIYQGVRYNGCTKKNHNKLWCAVTPNYDVDGLWGNCASKPRQKTTIGEICVFPFIYQGKRYNGCTKKHNNKLWCAVTPNYDVDGLWGNCAENRLKITQGLYAKSMGCFKDTGNRAIPTLERKSRLLVGRYQTRRFPIEKCALAAAKRGWKYFAVQDGGWCASGGNAGRTYKKYGRSNACKNGRGGPWGNDVYMLQGKPRQPKTTNGEICVFPFIYQGKRYNGCTKKNHNKLWCAVTPNYDFDKVWGNCA